VNPLSDAALTALAPVLAPSEVVRDGHRFRPRSGIQRWAVDRSLSVRLGPVRQTTGQLAIECCGRTSSVFLTHAEIPAVDALVAEIRRRIYRQG
jgi:hypothetical protein